LTNETALWGQEIAKLKSHRTRLSNQKKAIEDRVAVQDIDIKVVKWIKHGDDPEVSLADLEETIYPENRH
jgi:hypothetical protein